MSRALTMKPARSLEWMTCLPRTSVAKAAARSVVSGLVTSDDTNSTRGSTGTGLKKCRPTTCSGRRVTIPNFIIGIDDVLEAKMAWGSSTVSSSERNIAVFKSSASVTASITSCRSAIALMSAENVRASSARVWDSTSSLPRRTALASEDSIRSRPAFKATSPASTTTTSRPARAHTSAIPEPINPHPTIPTLSICTAASLHLSRKCLLGRRHQVRTIFPRACPSPKYRKASATSLIS